MHQLNSDSVTKKGFLFSMTINHNRQRVRVVKELDLKSNGLRPHRFEPCRCRLFLLNQGSNNLANLFIDCQKL